MRHIDVEFRTPRAPNTITRDAFYLQGRSNWFCRKSVFVLSLSSSLNVFAHPIPGGWVVEDHDRAIITCPLAEAAVLATHRNPAATRILASRWGHPKQGHCQPQRDWPSLMQGKLLLLPRLRPSLLSSPLPALGGRHDCRLVLSGHGYTRFHLPRLDPHHRAQHTQADSRQKRRDARD